MLITGFGPFPTVPINPSETVARRLAAHPRLRRLPGGPARLLVLQTAYDDIEASLVPALAERPAAILMFGVSARAKRVRVEIRALNRVGRLFPDASGRVAARSILEGDGPALRRSFVTGIALRQLKDRGISAALSRDAGRYLCNASYYRALREECPVLFLHIPAMDHHGGHMARLIEGTVGVAYGLVRTAREAARQRKARPSHRA